MPRVLLVEPDEVIAAQVADMLGHPDGRTFTVDRAPVPEDAAVSLRRGPTDVVLFGLRALDPAAQEAISRLALAAAPAPLVVMLDGEDERTALAVIERGAQECLPRAHASARMLTRTLAYAIERRRSAEALAESEARFRRLAENAPDLIYRVRLIPEFAFEFVSRAAVEIVGYTPEEHYADPGLIQRIMHPDHHDRLPALLRGEIDWNTPALFKWTHRDGRIVWTEHRFVPIRDGQGRVVAVEGVARDVTDRIRSEEALRLTEQQLFLSQKLEAIGQLAGGVAHDFNNVLTSVLGYADLLRERLPAGDANIRFVGEITKAGERARNLTQQLLAFSRKQVHQPRVLDLNDQLAELEALIRPLIGEDVELRTLRAPRPVRIKADPGQIEQVLMNLVVNSRDAMPEGGTITIETATAVLDEDYARRHVAVRPGLYARLTVSDTGCGMDREVQAHIFEPFFTTKEKGKGTGLGLSTVYGIVKQTHGNIWVYSEPGRGTSFKIYLPLYTEIGEPAPARDDAPVAPGRGSETILLAEDEPAVRALAADVLASFGYRVLIAADGPEALALHERYAAERIDLLVTDVVMPRMSGRILAETLRPLRAGLKVLFMSGYTEDAIIQHGLLVANIAFLEKPFTPSRLAAKVREVLDAPAQPEPPLVV